MKFRLYKYNRHSQNPYMLIQLKKMFRLKGIQFMQLLHK